MSRKERQGVEGQFHDYGLTPTDPTLAVEMYQNEDYFRLLFSDFGVRASIESHNSSHDQVVWKVEFPFLQHPAYLHVTDESYDDDLHYYFLLEFKSKGISLHQQRWMLNYMMKVVLSEDTDNYRHMVQALLRHTPISNDANHWESCY